MLSFILNPWYGVPSGPDIKNLTTSIRSDDARIHIDEFKNNGKEEGQSLCSLANLLIPLLSDMEVAKLPL